MAIYLKVVKNGILSSLPSLLPSLPNHTNVEMDTGHLDPMNELEGESNQQMESKQTNKKKTICFKEVHKSALISHHWQFC